MDPVAWFCDDLPVRQRQLRLAVVTETYPPEINGVAMTLGRMVAALQARNHRIQLIRPRQHARDLGESQPNLEQVLQPGLPIPRYQHLRMGLPVKFSLMRLWRAQQPDLVHIVTEGPLGWSALSAALKLGIPTLTDFHTNFHQYSRYYGLGWLKTPIASYLRKFHNRSQLTLVPSQALRDELLQSGYQKIDVVSRGVDTGLFHPSRRRDTCRAAWGAAPADIVALYVGRLAPEKNLAILPAALAALRTRYPTAKLVLVGDGPYRAELARAIPDAHFAGTRTGEALAEHYASADIFLFPSLTETFGNVTLEAMASGLAVVAYDYAAARELICHGREGLLARYRDTADYLRLLQENLDSPMRIREIGKAARKQAELRDWERIHDRFEHILHALVHQHERHRHAHTFAPDTGTP